MKTYLRILRGSILPAAIVASGALAIVLLLLLLGDLFGVFTVKVRLR